MRLLNRTFWFAKINNNAMWETVQQISQHIHSCLILGWSERPHSVTFSLDSDDAGADSPAI